MTVNPLHSIKIISGGQTGTDRAALDFAMGHGLEAGGWCPKGRLAEDGVIPRKYPLTECGSAAYPVRTRLNVMDSDATLMIYDGTMDRGTVLTRKTAEENNKPLFLVDLAEENDIRPVRQWLKKSGVYKLNIAGPRESFSPGIYLKSLLFLKRLFE